MASETQSAGPAQTGRKARKQRAVIHYPSQADGDILSARSLAAHTSNMTRAVAFGYLALAVFAGVFAGGIGSGLVLAAGSADASGTLALDHGVIMDCFAIIPALVGAFGTGFVPGRLGSPAMAAPRLALAGLILVGLSFVGVLAGPVAGVGPALVLWCVGTVVQAAVLLATVANMRAPGVGLRTLSPFVWSQVATAAVLVIAAPIFAAHLTRAALDGVAVASVLREFSFPLATLVLLPACGLVSLVIDEATRASRRTAWVGQLVSVSFGVMATGAIVWAHDALRGTPSSTHMLNMIFLMPASLAMVACWMGMLWRSPAQSRAALPWAAAFAIMLVAGWAQDVMTHGAGSHEAAALCAVLAAFSGFYRWLDVRAGALVPVWAARVHFVLTVLAMGVMLLPGRPVSSLLGAFLGVGSLAMFAIVQCLTLARYRPFLHAVSGGRELRS